MITVTSKKFDKKSRRIPRSVQNALVERLSLFVREPFHPILDNHWLKGEWRGYRSIDITGDFRAIYEPIGEDAAHFVDVDTHHNLYGT